MNQPTQDFLNKFKGKYSQTYSLIFLYLIGKKKTTTKIIEELEPFKKFLNSPYTINSYQRVSEIANKMTNLRLLSKEKDGKEVYFSSNLRSLPFIDEKKIKDLDPFQLISLYVKNINLTKMPELQNLNVVSMLDFFSKIADKTPLYVELIMGYGREKRKLFISMQKRTKKRVSAKELDKYEKKLNSLEFPYGYKDKEGEEVIGIAPPLIQWRMGRLRGFMKESNFLESTLYTATSDLRVISKFDIKNAEEFSEADDKELEIRFEIMKEKIQECITDMIRQSYKLDY